MSRRLSPRPEGRAPLTALSRLTLALTAAILPLACGGPSRDNPADPGVGDDEGPGIQLVATIDPEVSLSPTSALLSEVRFRVTAADMRDTLRGAMNLVGDRARGVALGVPDGSDRVFTVEAFDRNRIRTFVAADTADVQGGVPSILLMTLHRRTGSVELTSQLPPEIVSLEVDVVAGADTTRRVYEISEPRLQELIDGIPTGTGARVVLRGVDAEDQVLVAEELRADVRDDLLARVTLAVQTGAVAITASFPDYVPAVPVDRFSDSAAVFYRRSIDPSLPGPGEPIDFDELALHEGLGPNGERIDFYNFDVHSKTPASIYVFLDRRGDPLTRQLPVFDNIPGDPGYNDLRRVVEVQVNDPDYQPNTITSLADIQAAAVETTVTELIMNCVMVPDGSTAALRFDPLDAVGLHDGWYRDQVVRYLLFEHPDSRATVEFGGLEVSAPVMYGFFDNNRDAADGFATDADGLTHNVVTRLPEQEGYSPLWALRVFRLGVFDRVTSVASAQDNDREDNIIEPDPVLLINAPVVDVRGAGGP